MDVVRLDVEFQHLHILFLPTKLFDLLTSVVCYLVSQNSVTVFWTEHDVIFALID